MRYVDDLRTGFGMMLHPAESSRVDFGVRRALLLYYELVLIPIALLAVFSFARLNFGPQIEVWQGTITLQHLLGRQLIYPAGIIPSILSFYGIGYMQGMFSGAIAQFAAYALLIPLVLVPIGLICQAAIYHLVGKRFLNLWGGAYKKTFTGVVLGSMPLLLFFWLSPIPLLGLWAAVVLRGWNVTALTIGVAEQQRVERFKSAIVVILLELIPIVWLSLMYAISNFGVFNGAIL